MITKDNSERIKILVVGLGGIGSQLTELVVPVLSISNFSIELTLMDGDVVEPSNLAHQRFTITDLNQPKVIQLAKRYESFGNIAVASRVENLISADQLKGYDIVVVAVDRDTPRNLVHSCTAHWVDLRCQGDGWLLLDNNTDESVRRQIPTNQHPVSCQMPGAIENGNIELARRDDFSKNIVSQNELPKYIKNQLIDIQKTLFDRAKKIQKDNITIVDSFDDFKDVLNKKGGFILAHWDGTEVTEIAIKNETKATIRCIPFENKKETGTCVYSGKPSKGRVFFAKAY